MQPPTPDRYQAVGILYENVDWLEDLFRALERRGIPYRPIYVDDAALELDSAGDCPLYFSRVSPSSYVRGHLASIGFAAAFMQAAEARGARIVNGSRSFQHETSKVSQHLLFERVGVRSPRTLVFTGRRKVRALAHDFPFPAVLKPDTGGSGALVRRVESYAHFLSILDGEEELAGPNGVVLLQELLTSADGSIVRIELVDGELVYAMRAFAHNTFNLCPAASCRREPADPHSPDVPDVRFEPYPDVPADAVEEARLIVGAAGLDVGGIEYLETPDGRFYYDVNSTSVYRSDVCRALGVDAMDVLGEFLAREWEREVVREAVRRRA